MKPIDLLIPHFKSHWRTVGVGLLSLIVVDFLQLSIPRVIKTVVDSLTDLDASPAGLGLHAATIAAMALLIGLFRYVWRRCLLGTARKLEETLRNRLLGHIQTLSADYFDTVKTGDLMAHATNDIQQVRMAAGMGLVAFNDAVVLGTAAVGFMLYINVQLTLYVLIPMPFIVLSTRLLGRRMHLRYRKVQAAFADLTEVVRERFGGIRMIKAHGGERSASRAVQHASRHYIAENIRLVGVTGLFFPMMLLLTNLSLAIVLYFGGRKTILGDISPGEFVAFISYLNLLAWPMMALGWVTNLIQRGGASLHRLKTIFEREPSITNRAQTHAPGPFRGRVRFQDVSFAYDGQAVLQRIDLDVAPGRMLGIIGPPGSGKTTLLSLVPRLYDVGAGRITLDGVDIRDLPLSVLRRQIAYVPQEPFLFAGTIEANLRFGSALADNVRLQRAIIDAGLQETIARFPQGLDTIVGEKGILLSGGQKQRVALARALLVDAPIILLDDPISQVDTATGHHISRTIAALVGRKTVLIVSHRMSAVQDAHQVVTLHDGRLTERGTHDTLMADGGYYATVFGLQELEHAV